ncbi:MAG: hypothetical protein KF797_06210 [Flavobacteriales bacterium]|nr:hypothetical protein [Flavobacteriales bacterium]
MSSSTSSSEPLRLLLRAAVGGCLMAAILFLGYHDGHEVARVDYHGATAVKEARLAALPSPKVVVIGGSNTAFGMDSELLERALCRPVVNMGIHGGLGMEFMVNEVKGRLGPGDLVIAAFELSCYAKPVTDNEVHVLTADLAPGALDVMPWYRRPRIHVALAIMRCQAAWKHITGEWEGAGGDRVYRADGFNTQGDMVAHLGLPQRDAARQSPVEHVMPAFHRATLPVVRELADSVAAHGARLVVTWPAIAASSRRPDIEGTISTRMAEAGYPLLGDPATYVFPDTAFHDTHYHLRAAGRRLRTERLIHDLCASGAVECCVK